MTRWDKDKNRGEEGPRERSRKVQAGATRRQAALEVLAEAARHIALSDGIEEHAKALQQAGIKPLDALHLASAVAAEADYFGTCDDAFLNKAKRQDTGATRVVSLLDLAEALDQWLSQQGR